ncbi:MAG: RNA pseudouridine synthase [Phycisphaerales bacterium]|nr:RNA pseudouridine synthase [Phycisphaerales bacterium]
MIDLPLLHQGRTFAVVVKPAGLRTVPGRGDDRADSVETRLRALAATDAHLPDLDGPVIVHRLDADTSGLLVVAFTRDAHQRLSRQFMHRKVGKTYIAVLDGTVRDDEGAIDLPLIVDWPNRPRQMVDHVDGRAARTLYRVIERTETPRGPLTRVEFRPMTGRSHQLRVHAATARDDGGLGCPILGDPLYGDLSASTRMLLHANHLAFWSIDEPDQWVKFSDDPPF